MTLPTPRNQSGLAYLVEQLEAFFSAQRITASVKRGWRQRAIQVNQGPGGANRVVIADADGDCGELTAATQPGRNPRPLYNWRRAIRISVWAHDSTSPNDEGAQEDAAEALLESTLQGLHLAAVGQFHPGKMDRTPTPNERVFGCEYVLAAELDYPLFDLPKNIVVPTPAVGRGDLT